MNTKELAKRIAERWHPFDDGQKPKLEALIVEEITRHLGDDTSCITRVGESNGKAFVVYLRDRTKVVVKRDATTKGPAWLGVERQAVLRPCTAIDTERKR